MISSIGIEKLKVMTVIGVHGNERKGKQELLIDLKVETDISKCVSTDALTDALDYVSLKFTCEDIANTHSFKLIESFAAAILRALQAKFPLSQIRIKVLKPKAIEDALAFVEIEHIP